MRRITVIGGILVLALLLGAAAFVGGRLLAAASGADRDGGGMGSITTADGKQVRVEWVSALEQPASDPAVAGAFARRQDNSILVDKTRDGFVIGKNEDGSLSVTNTTGQIHEVVVTAETALYVDSTLENPEAAISDGKLYQQLDPGSIDEIGELSFVRAWGEMRGDRLVASVVVYSRAPVLPR